MRCMRQGSCLLKWHMRHCDGDRRKKGKSACSLQPALQGWACMVTMM